MQLLTDGDSNSPDRSEVEFAAGSEMEARPGVVLGASAS